MTQEKQIDLLEQFHKDKMETLISKGKDYASKDDILSNFKNSGAIVGVSKERQILSLIATKVARLGNLLDNKDKPNNESIEDTVKDLSGYVDLMYCAFKENQKDIIADLMNNETQDNYKVGDEILFEGTSVYIKSISPTNILLVNKSDNKGLDITKRTFDSYIVLGIIELLNNN